MIKRNIFGNNLKEQLLAGANDRLYRFLMLNDTIRGVILHGTKMINEMRSNHGLDILETLVLGQAYLTAGLLSANLKGNDRLSLQVDCSGPIKGFSIETNAYNEVRGYLKNVPIPVSEPLKDLNLNKFFGAGMLTVTKYLESSKNPFTGTVILQYGDIAKDIAHYYAASEQIPTSFNLSIHFDNEGNVTGAGAMFLQAMPGADEKTIESLEEIVKNFPSIGAVFSKGKTPVELITGEFADYSIQIISDTRIDFFCHCSKERMLDYLKLLPPDDKKDIIQNGPFPLEIKCHYCNSAYHFEKNELENNIKTEDSKSN